jgi:hypothetical protein
VNRAVFAIARLTLREALRSRIVLLFGLLLAAVVCGLPAILKGDGTPAGLVRMTLGYTLGAAFGLMVLANLWTGCALVSGELAMRTLELTRVKPVTAWRLWLGKWLGLLLLDLCFLAGVYAITCASVLLQINQHPAATAVMRTARLKVKPELPAFEQQLEQIFHLHGGSALQSAEQRELRRQLRRELPFQPAALQRGHRWDWRFSIDAPPDPRQPIWLRFQFDTDAYTRAEVKARCRLTGEPSGRHVDFLLDDFSTRLFEIPVEAAPFRNDTRFTLTLEHGGGAETGPLLIQPRQGLDLLIPRSPLPFNLMRAAALHFSLLALFAALSITLGTLFSLPVAAFCATGILLATLISVFVAGDVDAAPEPEDTARHPFKRLITQVALRTTQSLTALASPALEPNPLRQLAAAEQIPLRDLWRSLLFNTLLLPAGCGLVAGWALQRREFAA